MSPWSESADAADQIEAWNSAARDEIAAHRAADWLDIYDNTPTPAELDEDNR